MSLLASLRGFKASIAKPEKKGQIEKNDEAGNNRE
jgi:hypothetical protein